MNVGKHLSRSETGQQGTPTTAEVNWEEFATAYPQQAGWIADEAPRFDFAAAMLETARRYGRLTDRQSAAVDRCRARDDAPRSFDEVGIDTRGRSSGEFKALCPRCSKLRRKSTDRCLSVNASSGVWNCWHCGWSGALRSDRPATMPRPSSAIATTAPIVAAAPDPTDERKVADALRVWGDRGRSIRGTDAARYLIRRGGCLPPGDGHLRFVADLQRFRFGGPAMIALITSAIDARRAIGLHITWLQPNGAGRRERRIIGHTKDADGTPGIIRLWADDRVTMGVGVAEGIESALCAAHAFAPMWSLISADNLRAFPPLPGIGELTIFADHDPDGKGQIAATECAARWRGAGAGVRVLIADNTGTDVADEVMPCAA